MDIILMLTGGRVKFLLDRVGGAWEKREGEGENRASDVSISRVVLRRK